MALVKRNRGPNIQIIGAKFGKLTPIKRDKDYSNGRRKWLCLCECGVEKVIGENSFRYGRTTSCGCVQLEWAKRHTKTHGMSKTKEYMTWQAMHARCKGYGENETKNYKDRGIAVCKKWASFENFYAHMGKRPSPKHTLERKNNNKGYSPENCVWAIRKQQQRNTRRNRRLTINGVTKCMSEWCEIYGVKVNMIRRRLASGLSPKEAFEMPVGLFKYKRVAEINGVSKPLKEWSKVYNIKESTIRTRIYNGMDIVSAITTPLKNTA